MNEHYLQEHLSSQEIPLTKAEKKQLISNNIIADLRMENMRLKSQLQELQEKYDNLFTHIQANK